MSILSALNSTVFLPIDSVISSPLFDLSIFILSSGAGIIGEYKYNIINKIIKYKSHVFNEQAEINMNVTYRTKKDFDVVKNGLKDNFQTKYDDYHLVNEKLTHMTLNFDIFTVKIIHNEFNEIFFDFYKVSCGIKDLNAKVVKLISTLNEVNRTKRLFETMMSCEVTIYLPYNWTNVKIYPPEGFELDNYLIEVQDHDTDYKTKVGVRLNSINASGNSFEEITSLLQKLL